MTDFFSKTSKGASRASLQSSPTTTTSSANQASRLLSSVLERDNIEQVRMLHQLHQGIWPLKDTMFLSVFDRQTRVTGNGHMSGTWDN